MSLTDYNIMSYTNQDFESIMEEIKLTKRQLMPEYTDDTDTDFGNLILTYVGMLFDVLSWKIDSNTNEAIPALCETMKAMYKHCKWIGYKPKSNQGAKTVFEITIVNNGEKQSLNKGFKVTMEYQVNGDYVIYELDSNVDCTAPPEVAIGETYTIEALGTQGETVSESMGFSNGKADQDFYITYAPYIEGSLEVQAYNNATHTSEYYSQNENNSFVGTTDSDRVIVLEQVDSDLIKVKFGDGLNGKVPLVNTELIAHYRIGGGAIGNRPANSINVPIDELPANFISITNKEDARGGIDAESVDDIKKVVEKGGHKIIYSLMRKQDFDNFLSNAKRSTIIEKFLVCKDDKDIERFFRPIAVYVKPFNALKFDDDYKNALLSEMNELKLLDDEINIYDCEPVACVIECQVKSDGLTVESQLSSAIKYAIKAFIDGLSIGTDVVDGTVGLYTDDVTYTIRTIEGVSRFISLDKLWTKNGESISPLSNVIKDGTVMDMVLKRGQLLYIDSIDEDIKITFV